MRAQRLPDCARRRTEGTRKSLRKMAVVREARIDGEARQVRLTCRKCVECGSEP